MSTLYLSIVDRIDKVADRVQFYRDEMVQQNAQITAKIAILQAELNRLADDVKELIKGERDNENDRHELWLAYERLYLQVKSLNEDATAGHKAVVINNHTNTQVGDAATSRQTGTHNDASAGTSGD